jgi:hypothetical protein
MNIWKAQKRTLWQQLEAELRASQRRTLSPLEWVIFFVCLAATSIAVAVVIL